MRKLLAISLLGLSTVGFASDQERMNATYKSAYANAAVNCEYYYFRDVPKIETLSQKYSKTIGASGLFQVNQNTIEVNVTSGSNNGLVDFKVDGIGFKSSLKSSGGANQINHISIDLNNLSSQQASLAEAVQLKDIDCSVDIGMENHYELNQEQIHISMHPHRNYDVDGESIPGTLRELARPAQHLMLFDDSPNNRFKAQGTNFNNFVSLGVTGLRDSPFSLPGFAIPKEIPLRLSQAGHNRFTLTKPHHDITYSGGNHNFCILNNTRRVMHGFMESPVTRSITFKYPLDAIVVQQSTWLKDGNFSRSDLKSSNMLSNVFRKMDNTKIKKYLDAYYGYFRWNYFAEKKYYFATATFKQVMDGGYERTEKIQGFGTGHIDVTFEYIK